MEEFLKPYFDKMLLKWGEEKPDIDMDFNSFILWYLDDIPSSSSDENSDLDDDENSDQSL